MKDRQGVTFQERILALRLADREPSCHQLGKADLLTHAFSLKRRPQEPSRRLLTLPRTCAASLNDVTITEEAVRSHLKDINTKKAPGTDEVSPRLLRRSTVKLTKPLTHIFRHCLQQRVVMEREERHTSAQKEPEVRARKLPTHLFPIGRH